jgi:hypothetical protein
MRRLESMIWFVKHLAILAGWALMFISFLGFFLMISGATLYTVLKIDEIQSRQISMAETQHQDSLTVTRWLQDLNATIKQKNKTK